VACAYLILSHKNPSQVESLAARILELSPTAHVVVHHDRKATDQPWGGSPPGQVHLVERTNVEWGGWSIVDATLRLLRFATEHLQAEWMVIVSGEHWPVLELSAWERELGSRGADVIMPCSMLPRRLRFGSRRREANRDLARCVHRWFVVGRPRSSAAHKALSAVSKVSNLTHPILKLEFSLRNESWFVGVPRSRRPVKDWDFFKGSEWFALNAEAARTVLRADGSVRAWFQRSHIPDESYFQSLLYRDAHITIDHSVVTWVPPWPDVATAGWMLLKVDDLREVATSGAAFARKVDRHRNAEVIAAIDAAVEKRRSSIGAGA
jgi:hypothetical protein